MPRQTMPPRRTALKAEVRLPLSARVARYVKGCEHGCKTSNKVMTALLETGPHRVVVSRLGRIEVTQPIPHDRTPLGPHTHLFIDRLAMAAPTMKACRCRRDICPACSSIRPILCSTWPATTGRSTLRASRRSRTSWRPGARAGTGLRRRGSWRPSTQARRPKISMRSRRLWKGSQREWRCGNCAGPGAKAHVGGPGGTASIRRQASRDGNARIAGCCLATWNATTRRQISERWRRGLRGYHGRPSDVGAWLTGAGRGTKVAAAGPFAARYAHGG